MLGADGCRTGSWERGEELGAAGAAGESTSKADQSYC